MDQDRQIRFLISPFFLYASLTWWAYVDPFLHCYLVGLNLAPKDLLSIAAAAGAATIPLGFSIGTLGLALLRLWFFIRYRSSRQRQMYEASLSDDCLQVILRVTGASKENRDSLLYAAVTFDHELLPEGVHKWLLRRWNSFNVAFSSAFALLMSLLIVPLRILYTWSLNPIRGWSRGESWWAATNIFLIILVFNAARMSWRETMGMIEFQSRRANVYELKKRK
jgi:hypothetical protein